MPSLRRFLPLLFAALCSAASVFAQLTIDTVAVSFAGNAADPTTGYGAVAYDYRIGSYEVTNAQYATFLNAVAATDTYGLYNANMGSSVLGGITQSGAIGNYAYAAKAGYANTPVVFVSFWDAARFSNWLHNGQGAGSTETGAYTLLGGAAFPSNALLLRNGGASVWIASEDEWYKAAYYQPVGLGGDADNYWLHATQSNTLGQNNPFTDLNGANFRESNGDYALYTGSNNGATEVGTYANADSFFGTFDQGGNVWEWNDTLIGGRRGLRGGTWGFLEEGLRASVRSTSVSVSETDTIGFRVASLTLIPEPSTYAALAGLLALGFTLWRRRRA